MKEIEPLKPKERFLQVFQEQYKDNFLPADWDDEKRKKVASHVTSNKVKSAMYSSIPMNCTGAKCPFSSTCPLFKDGVAPVNHPCPIEMSMVLNFMADYIEQLDVNQDDMVEMSMIRDLVDQEVQYLRKTKILAKEDFIQMNAVGVDSNGDPIFRKELHLGVELEDRLHKRRTQLFKQLLATREAKVKAGMTQLDNAQTMANLMHTFKETQQAKQELLKQKMGIIDTDAYIESIKDD